MRLEALRIFRDIVREKSFTRAARRHFVTQSAVSQQIRELEKRFGVRLMERRGGAWELTEAGRCFDRGAGEVLEAVGRLEAELRGLAKRPMGPLRVVTTWSVGLYGLPRAVRGFMERHPDVHLVVDYASAPAIGPMLLEGRADVGIVAFARPGAGVRAFAFGSDSFVLCSGVRSPFGRRRTIGLEELDGAPMIAFSRSLGTRRHLDDVFRGAGVKPRIIRSYANIEMVRSAVEANLGVAFLPRELVKSDPRLQRIGVRGFELRRPLSALVRTRRAEDPLIRAFVAQLRREFGGEAKSSNTSAPPA